MWRAARDWVLKSEGSWHAHKSLVKKTTQEYRRWQEREGPDSKIVSRIIDQAALTLLPKGFAETVPWNCDYFTHTSVQSVSRVLRFQRKTPSVQTSSTQGNEDAKHCHIQTPKKISAVCVLDINMVLCPNRTSGSMKREKKSQDRKRRMINRRPKETKTSWFSPWTFRWSCWLQVYLQMQITTKPSFTVMTLQSTSCLTVMSCITSGMRWTVNWRTATLPHAFLDHLESVVDDSVSTMILYRDGCWNFLKRGTPGWRLNLYTLQLKANSGGARYFGQPSTLM